VDCGHDRPGCLEAAYDQIKPFGNVYVRSSILRDPTRLPGFDDLRLVHHFPRHPFFYWEFLVNDQPATKGIDNTTLSAGDSFEQYIPVKHKGSLLETKREFQEEVATPKK
jgi:hypothetical protein